MQRPRLPADGFRVALVPALVAAVLTGCVPTPADRSTASPGGTTAGPTPAATATPAPSPAATGPSPTPSFIRPTPTPHPTFLAYTVRPGDTLLSIARAHRTTGRSIAFWNRTTYPSLDPDSPDYEPDRIEAGWVLLLVPDVEVDPEEFE